MVFILHMLSCLLEAESYYHFWNKDIALFVEMIFCRKRLKISSIVQYV